MAKMAQPDESSIREALERVAGSETFDGANRLKAFLAYVTDEALAGRSDMIRAKRIAEDVYDRPPDQGPEHETLVRVDAGRLRRRLSLYYAEEGRDDPVRIVINPGGYAPTFETPQHGGTPVRSARVPLARLVAGGLGLALVGVIVAFRLLSTPDETAAPPMAAAGTSPPNQQRIAENMAVFDKSPSAMLARTHIKTARELIYPPLSAKRVQASLDLCEEAKTLDPDNAGAFSCASRARGFQAFLMDPGPERDRLVERALEDARSAADLGPAISYSVSALAWATYLSGDFDEALELAHRSLLLDPGDSLSRNYLGLMASFGGDFDRILAGPPGQDDETDAGFSATTVTRALFHTGSYAEAIELVEKTAAQRGQTSPFMLAVLAAAHQALGNREPAARYARELADRRPDFRRDFQNMYRRDEDANQLIELIDAALAP